jgi:GNAT superfamily N-acetyltransferase
MLLLHCDPPTPTGKIAGVFVQTIQLQDGDRHIGRAIWSVSDAAQGVVQILELTVDPAVHRSGHGRRLLRGVIEQARAFHKPHKTAVRRLWIGVGHKSQVVGRSFLSGEGFHHVATTSGLMRDEDLLVYVKSLD